MQRNNTNNTNNINNTNNLTPNLSYNLNQHGIVVPTAESIAEALSEVTSIDQLEGKNNILGKLFQQTVDKLLEAEMDEHLGYGKHQRRDYLPNSQYSNPDNNPDKPQRPNYRNGVSSKKIKTSYGELDVAIPRDRSGEFKPTVVSKHQKASNGLEAKILSLYAMGNTTTEISEHLADMYGYTVSPQYISTVTNKILPMVEEWQGRELERIYPIVFLDAIKYKVRIEKDGVRKVIDKSIYIVLGINIYGRKEVLGVYPGDSDGTGYGESAKYWMYVLSDLRQRGVEDILICSTDNLTGMSKALESTFPNTKHQKCIVHQVRNSMRFVSYKHLREFTADMKRFYRAKDLKTAESEFKLFKDKWNSKYTYAIKSWETNWNELMEYMQYPSEIRRIIYTTNTIESINKSLRKATKKRLSYTSDDSIMKCLYLAIQKITKKWDKSIANWAMILNQLTIVFEDRITKHLDSNSPYP